jgi:hypothetical protein
MGDFNYKSKTRGGKHRNPIYCLWINMLSRCERPKDGSYNRYGGRGITVCDQWHDWETFSEDAYVGWSEGLSFDRIDNNKGYSPDNCKWSTAKEQANNRRSNRVFTINGITKTMAQWIDFVGLKSSTVCQRFYVYNWPITKALGMGGQ